MIRTLTAIVVVCSCSSFFYFAMTPAAGSRSTPPSRWPRSRRQRKKCADQRSQQRLRLTLKKADSGTDGSDKIITKYPTGYAVPLFDALTSKDAQVSTVVNQGSILGSLLIYVLPLLLLVGLFMMFSRMQGGARMGFGFGKSRASCSPKTCPRPPSPMSPAPTRRSRSSTKSRTSCRTRRGTRRLAPRSPKVCCSTGRREPERPCWPAPSRVRPGCRSSPSPDRLRRDVRRRGRIPGA